ncbi:Ig domain-containing protein [Bacillus sp. UMB0899]|uniref:Ig domain-containing protein n=1 Tax=Metabacillus sp. YM-086 TaxID=3341729 RepID=UPI000C80C2EC|nr:Ig domain-containing protein [Bacillus sp. UMB0899]
MFNPFETNTNDVQFLLDNAGKDILINGETKKALITNPSISEAEERYIHTLLSVSRGDLIELEGDNYLVITESVNKRNSKFKALIRHCNYEIEVAGETTRVIVGYNQFGEPIYEDIVGKPSYVPSIVDKNSFSVSEPSAIRLPDNQISVIVQGNDTNNEKFTVNFQFTVMGSEWKVINRDFTKNGLLILICESV